LEFRIESLNQTVLEHSELFQQFVPVLNGKDTTGTAVADFVASSKNLDDSVGDESYFYNDDVIDDEVVFANGNVDYVTFDFLEKTLETLRNNFSLTQQDLSSQQYSFSNKPSRLESSNAQTPFIPRTSGDVNIDMFNHLQTNVDVLNTSVAVQSSMLQQAIRAMGEYDRRLVC